MIISSKQEKTRRENILRNIIFSKSQENTHCSQRYIFQTIPSGNLVYLLFLFSEFKAFSFQKQKPHYLSNIFMGYTCKHAKPVI